MEIMVSARMLFRGTHAGTEATGPGQDPAQQQILGARQQQTAAAGGSSASGHIHLGDGLCRGVDPLHRVIKGIGIVIEGAAEA